MTWLPFPIVMGMFAGSILEYGTRRASGPVEVRPYAGTPARWRDSWAASAGPSASATVGLAAVGGAIAISLRGNQPPSTSLWSVPALTVPQMSLGQPTSAAITPPMIVLSMGLRYVRGLRLLSFRLRMQAGCDPASVWQELLQRSTRSSAAIAIVARTGVATLAAKEAGPAGSALRGVVVSGAAHLVHRFRRHIHCGTRCAFELICVRRPSHRAWQDSLEKSFPAASDSCVGRFSGRGYSHSPFSALALHLRALLAGLAASGFWSYEDY